MSSLAKLPDVLPFTKVSPNFLHHPRREGDCEAAGYGSMSAMP